MVNLLLPIRLAQSILKRKFRSADRPLRIEAPPKISPAKRAFEKYKSRGLFSEFYGSLFGQNYEHSKYSLANVVLESLENWTLRLARSHHLSFVGL